jgi:hypothetical protein
METTNEPTGETTDLRTKLLEFVPHLRHAFEEARREGIPKLAVIASRPDGGGKVVAQFDGDGFLSDICGLLGVPASNSKEQRIEASAAAIVAMFGPVHHD